MANKPLKLSACLKNIDFIRRIFIQYIVTLFWLKVMVQGEAKVLHPFVNYHT